MVKYHLGATYFDADDEEAFSGLDSSSPNASLTWRGDDPTATWSDWTVIISSQDNNNNERTYHVHRNILAAGLRRSDYFQTLFTTQAAVREQSSKTSRISLSVEDAANFELLLDFFYHDKISMTVDNVVSLRSLARYFQCRELWRQVNEFVARDLNRETAVFYLRNAYGRDEKLERSARNLICQELPSIPIHSMDLLSLQVFESVVCSPSIVEEHHPHVSMHVKSFFDVNPDTLSATLLLKFTTSLTKIDKSVAHGFLELLQKLDDSSTLDNKEQQQDALDDLAVKCATALRSEWKMLDTTQYGKCSGAQDARCIVPLLQHALQQAQVDYEEQKQKCAILYRQNQVLKRKVTALMSHRISIVDALPSPFERFRQLDDSSSEEEEEEEEEDEEESSLSSDSSSEDEDLDENEEDDDDSSDSSGISDW